MFLASDQIFRPRLRESMKVMKRYKLVLMFVGLKEVVRTSRTFMPIIVSWCRVKLRAFTKDNQMISRCGTLHTNWVRLRVISNLQFTMFVDVISGALFHAVVNFHDRSLIATSIAVVGR